MAGERPAAMAGFLDRLNAAAASPTSMPFRADEDVDVAPYGALTMAEGLRAIEPLRREFASSVSLRDLQDQQRAWDGTVERGAEGGFGDELQDQLRLYRQREGILTQELKAAQHEARLWQQRAQAHQAHIDSLHEELHTGREAAQRAESLERYLQSVPTREEFEDQAEQLRHLSRERKTLVEENDEAATCIGDLHARLDNKNAETQALQREVDELRRHVLDARDSKMGAVTELQGLVKQLTLERNSARDLYDKVAKELTTQVSEQHSLRQLVDMERARAEKMTAESAQRETYVKRLQQLERERIADERKLERALSDGEDAREQLLKRISAHATTIQELRESIKGLTEQNQLLISQNQTLRLGGKVSVEDLAAALRISSTESTAAAVRGDPSRYITPSELDALQDELGTATEELQHLYDAVRTRLHQGDADVGRLLGLLNPQNTLPPLFTRTADIHSRLAVVREMRSHITNLKAELTDQMARDIGSETCGVQ